MSTTSVRRRILKLIDVFGGRCVYCAIKVNRIQNHKNAASVDHAVPKSYNGSNEKDNLLLACRNCNNTRGTKSLILFMKRKSKLCNKNLNDI